MLKVLGYSKLPLALGGITLLALTACSSQEQNPTVSESASSVAPTSAPSITQTTSAPAAASTAPQNTPSVISTSASAAPVEDETALIQTQAPTPAVQEDSQEPASAQAPQPEQTATAPAVQPETAAPVPTGSVITVPAPGNNAGGTPEATQSATSVHAAGSCDYSNIHIAAATTEGAAGSRYITLTFTNSGATSCSLSGWPSVHYVDAAGQVIGAPASQAAEWTSSGELLQPGASTTATLRETRANLYGDTCQAVTAAGYQVGIPGTDSSLTLNFPAEACSNAAISQLSVGQVGANS